MIAHATLVALALGDLTGADADVADEHVLACGECAVELERLVAIGMGARALVREGKARIAVSDRLIDRMQRDGLVSRSYRLRPDEVVACSVGVDDVYALTCLEADFRGVRRVDLLRGDQRIEDMPIDRERGQVAFVQRSDFIRTLPSIDVRLTLVAVNEDGSDRTLAEYTLRHTALTLGPS